MTEAFLAEFPAREGDEPITRDFLRAELSVTRGELRGEMGDLRGDLTGQMADLRGDLTGQMADLRNDLTGQMADLRNDLTGRMAGLASTLRGEMTDLSSDLRTDLGGQVMQLQLAVAALEARIAQSEAAFQKESKRQLAIIVTAILGTGTAVLAGMAVSVAIIVSRMG
ncbi:MAG: hypothetical protein JNK12_18010 [Acidimicrobiales bacterium]|nr:hypothetical protein [Acidimicrobiales bacterium]